MFLYTPIVTDYFLFFCMAILLYLIMRQNKEMSRIKYSVSSLRATVEDIGDMLRDKKREERIMSPRRRY